jgi:hypothetical protein
MKDRKAALEMETLLLTHIQIRELGSIEIAGNF